MKKDMDNEETIIGKYSISPVSPQTDRWSIMIAAIAEWARNLVGDCRKGSSCKKVGFPFLPWALNQTFVDWNRMLFKAYWF